MSSIWQGEQARLVDTRDGYFDVYMVSEDQDGRQACKIGRIENPLHADAVDALRDKYWDLEQESSQ